PRPRGAARPRRRHARLRRMRFDGSDARRAANSSLVRLAPWWLTGRDVRHLVHACRMPCLRRMRFDGSEARRAANGRS
ncbi:hypothetical protein ACFYOW_47885, partial [Nocardia sp. NPDC006982]|uniref:hypothetical protein n=1 Tax=Nocardia sp. NPDC006982 TaxID=3364307 RepID=UPI0036CFBAB6